MRLHLFVRSAALVALGLACEEVPQRAEDGNAAGGAQPAAAGGGGGAISEPGRAGAEGVSSSGAGAEGVSNTSGASGSSGAGSGGAKATGIRIDGRRLLVDGEPYHMRGVCWNPVRRGNTQADGVDFAGAAAGDVPLMQAAGINTVRTYVPLLDTAVLDQLWVADIRVLQSVYAYGGDAPSVVTPQVLAVMHHPAILAWVIGNEWNYNGLYVDLSHADSMAKLNEVGQLVKAADRTHPLVTVYGELPNSATVAAMPDIDMWGLNVYRGISFGDTFTVWQSTSDKPMFLSEYGADAYNAILGGYDPASQAQAVKALTEELLAHSAAFAPDGVVSGGTAFEWADEWWKAGSPTIHDAGGVAPGGGPYPDQTFNEEWWGLVDIDRNPRAAYGELTSLFVR